ncbi:hypothetical protein [Sphingomonas sp.]|uniref:hypothetical protein n=1 Tax=Sphingomonas sp. TaxID=28214 RepID=UPI002B8396FC|nr:hypothetical protein [Sphingomonas sp.]HTG38215.1 hypothetical protein [Sphingomonas sp.]
MTQMVMRILFTVAVLSVTFFALVPGSLGAIIESGEQRHILAFAMLPAISALAWPRISLTLQWLGYTAFGGAIELAQGWMAVGRAAEMDDWLVDMAAATLALACVQLLRSRSRPAPAN